jgi:carboxypeptidase C (cathepsin A)
MPPSYNNDDVFSLNGTFGSQAPDSTANTTEIAAHAIYHMMQGFLSTFPQYNPPNNSSLGVNLFSESYGGKYGPVFAEVWEEENRKRQSGAAAESAAVDIHLTSLGLVNACVDDLVQGPSYASMLVNNSYGFQAVPKLQASLTNATFYQPGGCRELINQCRAIVAVADPTNQGNVAAANNACAQAAEICQRYLSDSFVTSGRSLYDIAHKAPDSYPPRFYSTYLNTPGIQASIGTQVNYTDFNPGVYSLFYTTGDPQRITAIPKLAALLQSGIRIGLIYGDRDFICNWMGGEAVSLALADAAGAPYNVAFPTAGYAPVIVNESYIGGVVRQFANLSFSRIYQAGHFVPASQPETAFQVFARIILGTSVSTGVAADARTYNTSGPLNATQTAKLPDAPSPTCFLRALTDTCAKHQISSIEAGKGVVINGAWYPASSDWPGMSSTAIPSTTSMTGSVTLTGVFTATSTPNAARASRAYIKHALTAGVLCLLPAFAF